MTNEQTYTYTREVSKDSAGNITKASITFDSKGYILSADGFSFIMWGSGDVNQALVGRHIDELAEMLKKSAPFNHYTEFEIGVHLPFLKELLESNS